jgi:hypothetical protein
MILMSVGEINYIDATKIFRFPLRRRKMPEIPRKTWATQPRIG